MVNIRDKIQEEACNSFVRHKKGIINVAQRVGKTKIVINILKKLFTKAPKVLILFPDNKIRASYLSDFQKWEYTQIENITLANYASIEKYEEIEYDLVVLDEIHDTSLAQRNSIDNIIANNSLICGLSGTISKDTENEFKLLGLPVIYRYSMDQAIKDGIISDYQVTVHLVELDTINLTPNKKGKMLSEKQKYDNYSFVIKQMKQDGKNFMHLALARNRISLSSIAKRDYLLKLLEKHKNQRYLIFTGLSEVSDSLGILSYHSKSQDDSNFVKFQNKEINHLALVEKGKLGISYTDLDGIILLNFTNNMANTSQAISRAGILDYVGKCSQIHIITINEKSELIKLEKTLEMLEKSKIKYIK